MLLYACKEINVEFKFMQNFVAILLNLSLLCKEIHRSFYRGSLPY